MWYQEAKNQQWKNKKPKNRYLQISPERSDHYPRQSASIPLFMRFRSLFLESVSDFKRQTSDWDEIWWRWRHYRVTHNILVFDWVNCLEYEYKLKKSKFHRSKREESKKGEGVRGNMASQVKKVEHFFVSSFQDHLISPSMFLLFFKIVYDKTPKFDQTLQPKLF